MLWPVSEYIRSARVLSPCALCVLPVDQGIRLSSTWQVWYSNKKNYEPTVHLGIDINVTIFLSIQIPQMNLTETSTSSLRLQFTLVIPSQYPPWQGIPIKDLSTPHCTDLSLSSICLSPIINQRNISLASTSSVPYHYQFYQHQASRLKGWT